ncbi:hypothetical protein COL922a_013571 [Colletotrichum nupharicola]|nr:hypothetical protein COL922a_013571 [Colletotrichum nupharicola]
MTECSETQLDPLKALAAASISQTLLKVWPVLQHISTLAAKSVHDVHRMCEPLYLDFDSLMVDLILLNLLNKI